MCAFAGVLVLAAFGVAQSATADAELEPHGSGNSVKTFAGLTPTQQANLMGIARDTWRFYADDVDPTTHLPMDNVTYAGGSATPTGFGRYTSAANIGVYLWAVVSANDLGLISRPEAESLIPATLSEVSAAATGPRVPLPVVRHHDRSRNPQSRATSTAPTETTPTFDNC